MNSTNSNSNATPLFDLLMSQYHTCSLLIFGRLGLFDCIHEHQINGTCISAEELAAHAKWSTRAASAMLISLVASGVLETEISSASDTTHSFQHRYKLTPRATTFLLVNTPGSLIPYFELFWNCSPQLLLEKADAAKKQDNFMLETGSGAPSALFINAMQGQTSYAAMVLASLLTTHLSDVSHFMDIAGGSGTLCLEICKASSHLKGSVYELANVSPITQKFINNAELCDRVNAVNGDMFNDDTFPEADCYGFGNVLHDWSDEDNMKLLQKANKSLPHEKGKIIIVEMLVAEDIISTTNATAGLNLVMVTNEDGRQYKASELKPMLENSGFTGMEVVSSPLTPYSAIIAYKN